MASSYIEDHVAEIEPGFAVRLAGGRVLNARRVLIATGLSDALPDIPGVRERWGRDLLHCPYCHGWEVRDQPLGVLGTDPGSWSTPLLIRQWSDDVVFFTHTYPLTAAERAALEARGVHVIDGLVARLSVVDDRLDAVAAHRWPRLSRALPSSSGPRSTATHDDAGRLTGMRARRERVHPGRRQRPNECARRLGGRQRRQSARTGDHRRGRRIRSRDRHQRRPRPGRRPNARCQRTAPIATANR